MHGSLRALLGSGNLNSGPYAWIADNSYTDLAPWPHVSLLLCLIIYFVIFGHLSYLLMSFSSVQS